MLYSQLSKSKWILSLVAAMTIWSSSADANVVGNDTQNFNPVAGAADFVTVQSSATLAPGRFNVGLFLDDATNTLPYRSADHQSHARTNDSLYDSMFGAGVGIMPGVELGVALPFLMHESVKDDATRGEFAENGNTGARIAVKWAAIRGGRFGLALIGSTNIDRVQDDPHTGQANAAIYNAEVAGDMKNGRWTLGLNLGYRTRQTGDKVEGAIIGPMGPEMLASSAISYRVTDKASLVGEVYGARPLSTPDHDTDRSMASAEGLFGVRYAFTQTLMGHAGVGSGLMYGLSTPDWRLYAGLVTEFGGSDNSRHLAKNKRQATKPAAARPAPAPTPAPAPEAPLMADASDPMERQTNDQVIAQLPTKSPDEVFVLRNINFAFDSDYQVLPGAIAELQKVSDHLASHPGAKLVIEGHCDFMGTDAYNDDLSMRRARTVRRMFIKYHDFAPENVSAVGYGKRRPMTNDASDQGRQLNRRVEIKIYFADESVAHH